MCSRFDPRTPAKALMAMLNVMNPKKVKDVRYLSGAVEDWEVKVKGLGTDHDVTIDNKIKSAVLTAMCPEEVQNMIFQWMDTKTTYEDLRDKVMALSANRAGEMRPKPMEVDYVKEDWQFLVQSWPFKGRIGGFVRPVHKKLQGKPMPPHRKHDSPT